MTSLIPLDIYNIQLVAMLAKIAPRFVISRVIQNSYFAENQTVQLLKTTFEYRNEQFSRIAPMQYEVFVVLSRSVASMDISQLFKSQKDSKISMKNRLMIKLAKDLKLLIRPQNCMIELQLFIVKQAYYTVTLREITHQAIFSPKIFKPRKYHLH